jgi:transposase-like protein
LYAYPKEQSLHLRSSNPIESILSGVRLRTDATKRMRPPETARYLVFKVVQRLADNWRVLRGQLAGA